jgi:cell wall-associated NlpC family hydrolase
MKMESHELIHQLQLAEKVAWSLHGLPYRWGGDDTIEGFDCSGMVIEILKSVGILPRSGPVTDWTAHGLWDRFAGKEREKPQLGCLAFYWNNGKTKIVHIEFCLDSKHTMGASGGGYKTTSFEAASRSNAFIKVRPIRKDRLAGYLNPFG